MGLRIGVVEYYGEEKVVSRHSTSCSSGIPGFTLDDCNLKGFRVSGDFVGVLPITGFLEQHTVIHEIGAQFVKRVYT